MRVDVVVIRVDAVVDDTMRVDVVVIRVDVVVPVWVVVVAAVCGNW